jgi:Zn-dependent M28 family amino/carboxypeptidase
MRSSRIARVAALFVLAACSPADRPRTAFDGSAALALVRAQLDFGPRVPGTEAHRRAGEWIAERLRQRAERVVEQRWTHVTASGDSLPMRNIFARFRAGVPERVLYLAHWDTRPVSDQAKDSLERRIPVPGANDGASGVAMLMALADVLAKKPPLYGVDLLFVDGEDYGDFSKNRDVLIGSRYFADHPPTPDYHPIFGVLFDMIGDADLQIYQEGHSIAEAPEVVARVWAQADDLGYSRYFVPRGAYEVTDDHLPLLAKGMRVIDVVDIDYPAHHTPQDTFDKVSARSLQVVGDVAAALVSP